MNEEQKLLFNFGGITFFAGMLIGVLIGFSIGRGNVSNQQDGTQYIEYELDTAYGYQQSAKADLERAERYAESSKVRLDGASGCTDRLQERTDTSAILIAECQQIIRRVQERGCIQEEKN